MLMQIRDYLRTEKIVSSQQITRVFQIDFSALEPMLSLWIRKGVIGIVDSRQKTTCKKKCASESCQDIIYYQYLPQS